MFFINPSRIDMFALHRILDYWMKLHDFRIHPLPTELLCDPYHMLSKFGYGRPAETKFLLFEKFYKETRIDFFMDETLSTHKDALFELQPHMLDYFLKKLHEIASKKNCIFFLPPVIKEFTEEELQERLAKKDDLEQLEQILKEEEEEEEKRRSKRKCVLKRTSVTTSTSPVEQCDWKTITRIVPVPILKGKRCNFNSIQWKRQQVTARKQLHRAVLAHDFDAVKRIAARCLEEEDDERRLDFDAIEWALRRLCKQLLPMAAAKAQIAREESIVMIDTIFESFRPLNLCRSCERFGGSVKCMCDHLVNVVSVLPERDDIARHLFKIKCECRAN